MYECRLLSLTGTWFYEYDGLPWYDWSHNNWKNHTGSEYHWTAEIYNKEDDLVGTTGARCDFSDCQYRTGAGGSFQNANIAANDIDSDDEDEWGKEWVSPTSFRVWDKNPNP